MTIHITYPYKPHYGIVLRSQQSPIKIPPQAVEHPKATSDTHAKFATGKRYKLTLQGLVQQGQIHTKMAHGTDHPNSWTKTLSSLLQKSFPPSVIKLQLCRSVPDCPSKQDISPTHEIETKHL